MEVFDGTKKKELYRSSPWSTLHFINVYSFLRDTLFCVQNVC